MSLPLQTIEYYNNSTGLNLRDSPTKVPETDASLSLNMDYSVDGAFTTRNGSSIMNPGHQMDQLNGLGSFDYRKSDGTQVNVFQNGSKIYQGMTNPTSAVTGLDPDAIPDMEFMVTPDDEYLLWGNGIDNNLKFDGTTWTDLSITAPGNPTVAVGVAGTLTGDFSYYIAFVRYDAGTGVIEQISDLNPVAQDVTATGDKIDITRPASTDPQVNGWVIYRQSPTSVGLYYQLIDSNDDPVIVPIATTTYTDDIAADGTVEADFTNQATPKSAVFEESFGCLYSVDAANKTDLYESKPNQPWTSDAENFQIFDGPITCVKRIYGVLFIGTDRSIWILDGRYEDSEPKRISSTVGILNNRCADGLSYLYILATNYKFFKISPTDFGFEQVRLDDPLSSKVETIFNDISRGLSQYVTLKYYSIADASKVVVSAPIVVGSNDSLIVYNETQAISVEQPVWQFWNHINAATLNMFTISGTANLYAQDYNGFIWKLDDPSKTGDGAEDNGTVTSSGNTTLTDSTQAWTVNEFVGVKVTVVDTAGDFQERVIISNTADTLTVAAWDTNPSAGDVFTVGGYENYHFTNWKSVTGSYDTLKQLWFILSNLNASGDYTIQLIIQFDFDQTISNQITLNINLQAANTIWGNFIWGEAIWGAQAVFQDRIRQGGRFRAIRFGFRSYLAGHNFQVNGFSISCQDKKLFYRSAQ